MIYLDNAATTFPKPPEVEHAVMAAFHTIGNAGRGAHAATLDASRIIYGTRERYFMRRMHPVLRLPPM